MANGVETGSRISGPIRVGAVMHRGVVTCPPDSSGSTVARIMAAHRIHSVVVTDEESLPALVTDVEVAAALHADILATSTAAELSKPAPIVSPAETLAQAAVRMHEGGMTHAVVVDPRPAKLVGILSVLDIAGALAFGSEL